MNHSSDMSIPVAKTKYKYLWRKTILTALDAFKSVGVSETCIPKFIQHNILRLNTAIVSFTVFPK